MPAAAMALRNSRSMRAWTSSCVETEAEGVDSVVALELDGGGFDHAFERGVASLEVRLCLVGAEHRGVADRVVVGDEREAPVGRGVVGDPAGVGLEREREAAV